MESCNTLKQSQINIKHTRVGEIDIILYKRKGNWTEPI